VPSLMMINREACDVGGYFRWVKRQLLTTRLYHPSWLAVMGHGIITTVAPLAAIGTLAAALLTDNCAAAVWVGCGLAFYQAAISLVLLPMEFAVRRIVASREEPTKWVSLAVALKYLPAVALTQIVYAAALTSALFLRVVDWRGVSYRIDGPWKIRLLEYLPYVSDDTADDQSL
jgi:hypothetical protein